MATNQLKSSKEDADAKQGQGFLYVKVSMDGTPYLRKVDLRTYKNYKDMSLVLEEMFIGFSTDENLPLHEACIVESKPHVMHGDIGANNANMCTSAFHPSSLLMLDQDLIPWDQQSDFIQPEVSRFQHLDSRKADVDLGKEGKANKISGRQARLHSQLSAQLSGRDTSAARRFTSESGLFLPNPSAPTHFPHAQSASSKAQSASPLGTSALRSEDGGWRRRWSPWRWP